MIKAAANKLKALLLFLVIAVSFAGLLPAANAQVVVAVGPHRRYHRYYRHPYRHRFYGRRYHRHGYYRHRGYYGR